MTPHHDRSLCRLWSPAMPQCPPRSGSACLAGRWPAASSRWLWPTLWFPEVSSEARPAFGLQVPAGPPSFSSQPASFGLVVLSPCCNHPLPPALPKICGSPLLLPPPCRNSAGPGQWGSRRADGGRGRGGGGPPGGGAHIPHAGWASLKCRCLLFCLVMQPSCALCDDGSPPAPAASCTALQLHTPRAVELCC